MENKAVVANVLTKLFSCGSNVPNTKLCNAFLWLRTKEEVMGVKWQSRTMRSMSSTSTVLLVVAIKRLASPGAW